MLIGGTIWEGISTVYKWRQTALLQLLYTGPIHGHLVRSMVTPPPYVLYFGQRDQVDVPLCLLYGPPVLHVCFPKVPVIRVLCTAQSYVPRGQ